MSTTPVIGIEKMYVALLTKDDNTGLTYAVPKYYENIGELGIKPKQNTEKLFAENRLIDQATAFDSADVEIEQASLPSAQRAELLGQTIAAAGGVIAKSTDVAPYVAILYKATIRGGYRYGVIYKGTFSLPDDQMKGQEGKIQFQTPKLKAVFQPANFNKMWEYHVDTVDPNCPSTIDTTWFNAVVIPDADITIPTLSNTTPANNAANVSVNSTFSWVFSEAIEPSTVNSGNFFVVKDSDGSLVTGTLVQSADKLTVTFTPSAALTTAIAYRAICTPGVKDLAGNALAAAQVRKFTTA
jgi:phi13 family phage major tail protein